MRRASSYEAIESRSRPGHVRSITMDERSPNSGGSIRVFTTMFMVFAVDRARGRSGRPVSVTAYAVTSTLGDRVRFGARCAARSVDLVLPQRSLGS